MSPCTSPSPHLTTEQMGDALPKQCSRVSNSGRLNHRRSAAVLSGSAFVEIQRLDKRRSPVVLASVRRVSKAGRAVPSQYCNFESLRDGPAVRAPLSYCFVRSVVRAGHGTFSL